MRQLDRNPVARRGDQALHNRSDAVLPVGDPTRQDVGLHDPGVPGRVGVVHVCSRPGGTCSRALSSMSMPSKLRNVSVSSIAARTSSNRVSAHQPQLVAAIHRGVIAHPPVRVERIGGVEVRRERVARHCAARHGVVSEGTQQARPGRDRADARRCGRASARGESEVRNRARLRVWSGPPARCRGRGSRPRAVRGCDLSSRVRTWR